MDKLTNKILHSSTQCGNWKPSRGLVNSDDDDYDDLAHVEKYDLAEGLSLQQTECLNRV